MGRLVLAIVMALAALPGCGVFVEGPWECAEGTCPGATEYCHSGQCVDLGMQWQNPPAENSMPWQDAIDYCDNLSLDGHDDWRLPSISELRSLIKGCAATETGGSCGVDDGCLSYDTCWDDPCSGCDAAGGCYWPDEMEGPCSWYWSSSPREDNDNYAWYVYFYDASVHYGYDFNDHNVRCVRLGG
jgi:hypothetical protein